MKTLHDFKDNFKYTLVLIAVSSIVALILFGKAVAISIILGGAGIMWGMSYLAKSNNKLLTGTGTVKHSPFNVSYLLRLVFYGVLLYVSYSIETLNIFGTLYGLLTFKISYYGVGLYRVFRGGKS